MAGQCPAGGDPAAAELDAQPAAGADTARAAAKTTGQAVSAASAGGADAADEGESPAADDASGIAAAAELVCDEEPAESLKGAWTESEKTKLVALVTQHGTGDWKAKADALGTGRGAAAVSKYWETHKDDLIAEDAEPAQIE